ncbi:MAG: DUF2029 domain-containing protein [Chloroflexota bacterium]|nr:DUF2029 domain-containing protein [Chloroflexota bacterium]
MRRVLTFKRARTYALVLIGLYVVAWGYELRSASLPIYSDNVPIGGDYIAFHAAGRLLLSGRGSELYDRSAVVAVQDVLLEGKVPGFYDGFRNPPFAALPFALLALVDLVPGYLAWSALSLGALGLGISLLLKELPELKPRWRGVLVLVFAFAPLFFGLIDGQNATLSLLLFVLLYRALARNQDKQAAIWAALGLFKPQLFVVFPLILLARRSWEALAVYIFVALGLGSASVALVGTDGLVAWLRILTEPESGQVLVNSWRMVSLQSLANTLLREQPTLAIGLYAAGSALLLGLLVRVWAGLRAPLNLIWVFTSIVAVLVDPHLLDYDLTVLIPAGILGAMYVPGIRWWLVGLYVVVVFRAQLPIADGSAIQLTVLVLCVCAGIVWNQLRPQVRTEPIGRPELRGAS